MIVDVLHQYNEQVHNIVDDLPSLKSIPLFTKVESQISRFRSESEVSTKLRSFVRRCNGENSLIVLQALTELRSYLTKYQNWIHDSAASEQPLPIVAELVRALLDAASRFQGDRYDISFKAAECLGIVGCVDPNRVETLTETNLPLVHSNFKQADEVIDFVVYLLENVLITAFQAASNPRAQGFLAYVMQELLKFCGFSKDALASYRPHGSQGDEIYQRWRRMNEAHKQVLTPFLNSHYVLKAVAPSATATTAQPIYTPIISHSTWIRDLVLHCFSNAKGDNAQMIFSVIARIIRGCDESIVSLLMPYATSNIIIDGSREEGNRISTELLAVLKQPTISLSAKAIEHLRHCSEDVFRTLDYLSRWVHSKKRQVSVNRNQADRSGRALDAAEAEQDRIDQLQIDNVEAVLKQIPSEVLSKRAADCGSYARAVLHWEAHMQTTLSQEELQDPSSERENLYRQLQELYAGIDEPDGIDGISASFHALDPEQQALEHRRAGRWTAAQSWYSLQVAKDPDDVSMHIKLMSCLREASLFTSIIQHFETLPAQSKKDSVVRSIAAEAAWSTGCWQWLNDNTSDSLNSQQSEFNNELASTLSQLHAGNTGYCVAKIDEMRSNYAKQLSGSTVSSVQSCRDQLFKLHSLYEVELLSDLKPIELEDGNIHRTLERRLDVLGSSHTDKQFLLSLRRAVAQASGTRNRYNMASSWMTTGKLARKGLSPTLAYEAVYQAAQLGDESSKIEQARLLWNEGEHRKAIRTLEGAIGAAAIVPISGVRGDSNTSAGIPQATTTSFSTISTTSTTNTTDAQAQQNLITARAQLLMAKWLDEAGQTQSEVILHQYRQVTWTFQRWEKGLFSLGKFYNKLLESEKALPPIRQNSRYLSGEITKLVIDNFLRALTFGCKYIAQSLPKLLTLWLEFGTEVTKPVSREVEDHTRKWAQESRLTFLEGMNKQVKKYAEKIPPFVFYVALAQMITRITHPNQTVWDALALLIVKVVSAHPQQALWSVLATLKSSDINRAKRGVDLINRLKQFSSKTIRSEGTSVDLKDLIAKGQRLSEELLRACEVAIQGRNTHVSLQKDLGFKMRVAPCPLVIPWEKTLTASLPRSNSNRAMRAHKAFPETREAVTVHSFEDSVLVLASLQKPRKLVLKGMDGRRYGILCKPNDDLRKDQRLMEFNAMINRALKKDAHASTRQLYVKTYAVTPLNEACGLIEWVEGLKPLRDILIASYRSKGVKLDYAALRQQLNEACANPPNSTHIFTDRVLNTFSPILHEWFTENFPAPDAWYAARTRYTRSCAVASMVGHTLGLGDRHGENVLLEEKNGGVFHVDFNCLFDKGLTFEKPELVPFRLTHNMIDAMGATGYEGFFRRSAEITMKVMREQEDALLTILETFVYDPTSDFASSRHKGSKYVNIAGITSGIGRHHTIPETPKEVLASVRGKLEGLLPNESLPLNVQGYVEALIAMAADPQRLARMYIGWCAFL